VNFNRPSAWLDSENTGMRNQLRSLLTELRKAVPDMPFTFHFGNSKSYGLTGQVAMARAFSAWSASA
jgi:hypothetical protein